MIYFHFWLEKVASLSNLFSPKGFFFLGHFYFFFCYHDDSSDHPGISAAWGGQMGREQGSQRWLAEEDANRAGKENKQREGSGAKRKGDLSAETSEFFFRLAWMDPIAYEYCSVLAPFHIYLFFGCKWLDSCLGSSWWLMVLY